MEDRHIEIEGHEPRVAPTEPKPEGGSYFDDELATRQQVATQQQENSWNMRKNLQQRPHAIIFVHSDSERREMEKTLEYWVKQGELHDTRTVRVDHRVAPGSVQIQ